MKIEQFRIGIDFTCGEKKWRCTDVGSRMITAICLSDHNDDSSWYNGPPYAVAEVAFDEDDQEGCVLVTSSTTNHDNGFNSIDAYTKRRNSELTCDKLTSTVMVRHMDNTLLLAQNAFLEQKDEWLIVYSEHNQPQIFAKADLDSWWAEDSDFSTETHWHYQVYKANNGDYKIYEDYVDEAGVLQATTEESVELLGESLDELITDLLYMLKDALSHPVKELKKE